MTAHDVSDLNYDWLQSDNLCAVTDRAYRGSASIQNPHGFNLQSFQESS